MIHTRRGTRSNKRTTVPPSGRLFLWILVGCMVNSIVTILIYEGWVVHRNHGDSVDKSTIRRSDFEQTLPLQELRMVSQQEQHTAILDAKSFVPCPKEFDKLVWFKHGPTHKLYEPVYRAFHSRGYSRTEDSTRAHYLWSDQPNFTKSFYRALKPWQRYSHFPNTQEWDDKDKMAETMNQYYHQRGIQPLHSFPESYVLHDPESLEAFSKRLLENGGMDLPWVLKQPTVNQGKGLVVLPPRSNDLQDLVGIVKQEIQAKSLEGIPMNRLVVQKYICDEMTYGGRKFDVRIFWAVASVDPLVVVFHTQQNYVRIGHALYDESKLEKSTTKDHLTTHTFGATETKATWDEFRELIETHVFGRESKFKDRFFRDKNHENSHLDDTIEAILSDPFMHVQKQMKTVIGHLANAYQNITFHSRDMIAENGFSWHAADMIIDNNLDVYIIEGTDGPGKDEDYDFRIKMHGELLGSLVDIVQEVTSRQEESRPLNVSEMKKNGIFGGYEVVYNDGWFMDYRYQRLPYKGCLGANGTSLGPNDEATLQTNSMVSTKNVVPAAFTALPTKAQETMTFWMKSRTSRTYEPVARSLRRNGWTPVNSPENAQLIYRTEKYQDTLMPWQWVSQFPSQFSFFEGDHTLYLDKTSGNVCRPIRYGNRPLEIIVYWLVLSLDPLIVLYHDGFLDFSYSRDDENEFLDLPKSDGKTETIWKGSWKSLEKFLNDTHAKTVSSRKSEAATAAAAISLGPISHVRNQMKASLVKMANGFLKHTMEANLEEEETQYSSYALFCAQFQVDYNLNVFANNVWHSYIKGEEHEEIVSLHDDLYGSAFRLLKYLNNTSSVNPGGKTRQDAEILGNYEWLIRPDIYRPSKSWNFRYDWKYKAKECFE